MRPSLPPRLVRHPLESDRSLRAWDAADALLLDWVAGKAATGPTFPSTPPAIALPRTAVVGDRFGAITLGLLGAGDAGGFRVYSDSVLSDEAIRINAERVGVSTNRWSFAPISHVEHLPSLALDVVLYKVPRSLAALENLLHLIRPTLTSGAHLIGAGMTRRVHSSTLDLLTSLIGPTRTSHARRRARLLHTRLDDTLEPTPNPWPVWWEMDGIRICNHAGVFSASGLDRGTSVMLQRLPTLVADLSSRPRSIVDLGCGNGILGTWLARAHPDAEVEFRDVSFAALRSAEATSGASKVSAATRFTAADGMTGREDQSVDLIVCNPPFHAQGARGEHTSRTMFAGAHRTLRPGGQLWVVGNRHLAYLPRLRRRFGEAEQIGDHARFNVVRAIRVSD